MSAAKRVDISHQLHEDDPEPRIELAYITPFELFITVILPAQVVGVGVNKAIVHLCPVTNIPETIHALGVEGLPEYTKITGLHSSKAKNVIETYHILVEKHGDQVPGDREDLEALPEVGRKTVDTVLSTIFRQLAMAVDTHIFHAANHTGIALGKNALEVEKKLLKLVPREYLLDARY